MITQRDKRILHDLAKRVAEIGSLPIMTKRREMWERHNRLERVRPMILVFPEGSWRELLPQSVLCCEGGLLKGLPIRFAPPHPPFPDTPVKERAREIEWLLRSRIYHFEHIHDDMVIEKTWVVNKTAATSGWGLEPHHVPSDNPTGAWGFDPVIKKPSDLKKLKFPQVEYDEKASQENLLELLSF